MKNFSFLFISILALTLFSCQKEESKLTNGQLTFTAGQQSYPDLKTNIGGTVEVTWNTNDQLAVFDGTADNKNKMFTLSNGADSKWATFTGTIDNWTAGSKTFYAVYPYTDANGSAVHTAYPITIPQTQVQDFTSGNTYNHLGLYDYLAAPPKTIEYAGKSTLADNFNFEHLMAVLDIEVTNTTGGDIKVLQIRMKRSGNDFTTTANLDLSKSPGESGFYAPVIINNTNQLILSVHNAGTTANTLKFTGSMMIAPVVLANLTNTDFEVSVLNASGQGELYTVTKTTGLSILAGERYTAKITISGPTLLTYDSKDYRLTGIGTQVWMAENLAYLPEVVGPGTGSETLIYYYVNSYDGDVVAIAKTNPNYSLYGVLYNYPAALTACPSGWHLPTDEEFTTLTTFLGGESVAGGKLKETGTTHWADQSSGTTNSSGFTALPGGNRNSGGFLGPDIYATFWSASWLYASYSSIRDLSCISDEVTQFYFTKDYGLSVRCLKDN